MDHKKRKILFKIKFPYRVVRIRPSYIKDQLVNFEVDNPTDCSIGYKVSSTRKSLLVIKPVSGIIKPGSKWNFTIKFSKLKQPDFDFIRDRLTIHLAIVPNDKTFENPLQFWKGSAEPPQPVITYPIEILYVPEVEGDFCQDNTSSLEFQKDKSESGESNVKDVKLDQFSNLAKTTYLQPFTSQDTKNEKRNEVKISKNYEKEEDKQEEKEMEEEEF
ncbi:hypothetical protein T4E_5387 [Trichinella pseudospiralis]|uniref:Major sperm protein n=1 Tax=Trichinella pseudospiralis TaxID=6337 RepID=A0A0V0XX54_TRIPS|nr:hypothetical protein T4E_5387 [Trichinella pseudospiralis]